MEDCWIYLGPFHFSGSGNPYGRYCRKPTHRLSYETAKGKIPPGLTIDHLCRQTLCINPDHLEAVTLKENILRGTSPSAINARRTLCSRGHEFSQNGKHRRCAECKRTMQRRNYWAKKAQSLLSGEAK